MKKLLHVHQFKSPVGTIGLASTDKGLALINITGAARFRERIRKSFKDYEIVSGGTENKKAEKQIKSYLAGRLKKFSLRLDLMATPFQRKVLKKVALIPYGKVTTYGAIARAAGNSKASRAVGMANSRNPLPIVIPCHRVVAADGPGGYGGGLSMKKRLLNLEASHI